MIIQIKLPYTRQKKFCTTLQYRRSANGKKFLDKPLAKNLTFF
jgi:hypothetical protein